MIGNRITIEYFNKIFKKKFRCSIAYWIDKHMQENKKKKLTPNDYLIKRLQLLSILMESCNSLHIDDDVDIYLNVLTKQIEVCLDKYKKKIKVDISKDLKEIEEIENSDNIYN